MRASLRALLGILIWSIGFAMLGMAVIKHNQLWAGMQTVTVTKTVTKNIPTSAEENGAADTGPVLIEYRYFTSGSDCQKEIRDYEEKYHKRNTSPCMATGEYQMRDKDNKILVKKFCDPIPDIHQGATVDIKYQQSNNACTPFISAVVIKEPE